MKEFTSTVTLTFEINNLSAFDKEEYIERLKEQYIELYDLEIKDHEISNIEEYTLEATEWTEIIWQICYLTLMMLLKH